MDNVTPIAQEPVTNAEPPKSDDHKPKSRSGTWPEATQDGFLINADKHDRPSLIRVTEEDEKLVSGGIWVKGVARNSVSRGWCNVVEFVDMDNNRRQWLMKLSLLASDKRSVLENLYERGLFIVSSKDAKDALFQYVSSTGKNRYTTVDRTGWHDDDSFVLPTEIIGGKKFILDNERPLNLLKRGTLKSWRDNVASLCIGNSRITFGMSCGFASPLLEVVGVEGGGWHFVGESSLGKSKVLIASTTVFGTQKLNWNLTPTWLEAAAATHSHIGMALDEMGEMDPNKIGQAVYMLSNGQGRGRGRPDATAKELSTHKLFTLTNGEKSLGEFMASVGKKTMAGQEVRLVDIEADAGKSLGIFENIHGAPDAKQFADNFDALTQEHTGHAGPEFIRYIIKNRKACKSRIRELTDKFFDEHNIRTEEGQVQRVATRFALVAHRTSQKKPSFTTCRTLKAAMPILFYIRNMLSKI